MAPVCDGVKASCPKSSVVKRPRFVRTWVVPMTMARILKSRMTVTCHVRFGSSGGVSDGPADCNLGRRLVYNKQTTNKLHKPSVETKVNFLVLAPLQQCDLLENRNQGASRYG